MSGVRGQSIAGTDYASSQYLRVGANTCLEVRLAPAPNTSLEAVPGLALSTVHTPALELEPLIRAKCHDSGTKEELRSSCLRIAMTAGLEDSSLVDAGWVLVEVVQLLVNTVNQLLVIPQIVCSLRVHPSAQLCTDVEDNRVLMMRETSDCLYNGCKIVRATMAKEKAVGWILNEKLHGDARPRTNVRVSPDHDYTELPRWRAVLRASRPLRTVLPVPSNDPGTYVQTSVLQTARDDASIPVLDSSASTEQTPWCAGRGACGHDDATTT